MRYCPKCRGDFQDWVKVCPDCGVDLVNHLGPKEPKPPKQKAPARDPDELVTIATFVRPESAHLAAAKLESEGIPTFVADSNIATIQPLYSTAIGGVRLMVRKADCEQAAEVLKIVRETKREAMSPEEACPKCHSAETQYLTFSQRGSFISWLVTFVLLGTNSEAGFMLPIPKRKWHCKACGYEWKTNAPPSPP